MYAIPSVSATEQVPDSTCVLTFDVYVITNTHVFWMTHRTQLEIFLQKVHAYKSRGFITERNASLDPRGIESPLRTLAEPRAEEQKP